MSPSRAIEHVVAENDGATAHCLNCGKKFTLGLPAPLSVWVVAMKEFCKIHKRCEPKAEQRSA
jgi:hypothetical protein